MNVKIKLAAYAVLMVLVIVFGSLFYSNYKAVTKGDSDEPTATAAAPAPVPKVVATNIAVVTNAASADTNSVADTNAPAATNQAVVTTTNTAPPPSPAPKEAAAPPTESIGKKRGAMIGYLAAFVVVLIGLGLLVAADVTAYMGSRSVDFLFDDKGQDERSPEYEKAEHVWAQGKHLEAIQMMREYLKENPRAQYVAIRIAEIYEKDLKNTLAAVLEYEEILKKKLPAEKWGWTAIHLCNIYTNMGQQDKTMVLLQKIVDDYPKTSAAKKARARLGIEEPVAEAAPAPPPADDPPPGVEVAYHRTKVTIDTSKGKINYADAIPQDEVKPVEPPPPAAPKSNLPPGFRPK